MSGGGTQTTTEQSSTTYPQWTQDAGQNTYSTGAGMLENFLRNPQYAIAGQTTDQMKAYDLSRDIARTAFTNSPVTVNGSPNLTAAYASPAAMTAAQVTPGAIQGMMNPYMGDVRKVALDDLRRTHLDNDASIAAKYAAGAGMGGSGAALARGQAARAYYEQAANTSASLQAAAYDKAMAAALANSQMEQQARSSNSGYAQQAGLANAGAENTMRTTGADYGIKAAQLTDQFRTNNQARQESARQAILQGGNQQQQFGQTALDIPWTALERLFGLTPKQLNSQTISQKESPDNSASPLQTIIGAGTTLLGSKVAGGGTILSSLMGLSDEREKTNIKKVGKDPETGLDLYSYDYKDDVEAAKKSGKTMPPKRVGPMAQQIEKLDPRAVREVGGKKVVQRPPGGILGMLAA